MSVAIQYAAKFHLDFAEVVNFLVDRDAVTSATRFVAAVAETIERIGESPELGEKLYVKRIRRTCRVRQVRRFPRVCDSLPANRKWNPDHAARARFERFAESNLIHLREANR